MADATRNPTERATWMQSAGNWLRKLDAAKATENQGLDLSECSSNRDNDTTKCKVLSRKEVRRMVDRQLFDYFCKLKSEFPEARRKLPSSSARIRAR